MAATASLEEKLRAGFRVFDQNNDGVISASELATCIRAQGKNPTEAQLKELMTKFDKNQDSVISFDEFKAMMGQPMAEASDKDAIVAAFKVFDANGDGLISLKELRRIMTTMGEPLSKEEVGIMMKQADRDGDDHINYTEFVDMYLTTLS